MHIPVVMRIAVILSMQGMLLEESGLVNPWKNKVIDSKKSYATAQQTF